MSTLHTILCLICHHRLGTLEDPRGAAAVWTWSFANQERNDKSAANEAGKGVAKIAISEFRSAQTASSD